MAGRFVWPDYRALDNTGAVEVGARLEFFASGTTTLQVVYTDENLTIVRAQPVLADGDGQFGDIFLQDLDYAVRYANAADVQFWLQDPVTNRAVTTAPQVFQAGDGTAVLPSYTFINAGDTGFFRDTSVGGKAIGVATSGIRRATINDAGKWLFSLHTLSLTTGQGNAGVIQINGESAATANMSIARASNDAGGVFYVGDKARGTLASPAIVQDGDVTLSITASAYDGTGFANPGVNMRCKVDDSGISSGVTPLQKLDVLNGSVITATFEADNFFTVNRALNFKTPITAPSNPSTGFVMYVDTADGDLKAKSSTGVVTVLALN